MAVSRKTNDAPKPGKPVNSDRFHKLIARIDSKKQISDDARSDLGSIFKEAEDHGFDRGAMKLAIKVRNMEVGKRNDFLANLNTYCEWLGVFAQADLFTEQEQGIGPKTEGGENELPTHEARSRGLRDGADGKSNLDDYEDGSPEYLAYRGGWNESQEAAVKSMGTRKEAATA